MDIKELRKTLDLCDISRTKGKNFYVRYPLNYKNEKKGMEELIAYIESSVPDVEILKKTINYINYYKGSGIRNQSHYKVEIQVTE